MEKEFVTYEQAVALRELGFDEQCLGYYTHNTGVEMNKFALTRDPRRNINSEINWVNKLYEGDVTAPLKQQVFRWFREKHQLNSEQPYLININKYGIVVSDMSIKPKDLNKAENFKRGGEVTNGFAQYDSYEEAENVCIDKLIELAKQQDK